MALVFIAMGGGLFGAGGFFLGRVREEPQHHESVEPLPVVAFGFVDVRAGMIPLAPGVAGKVTAVVEEGTTDIEVGTPLLELDATDAKLQEKQAIAELRAAELARDIARQTAAQHEDRIAERQHAQEAARQKVASLKAKLARAQHLNGLRPPQVPKEEVTEIEALVKSAEEEVKVQDRMIKQLQKIQPSVAVDQAEAVISAKKLQVERATNLVDKHTVKAPVQGTVLRTFVHVGVFCTPDSRTAAIYFCPAETRIIRAEIDQEFAARVKEGQTVLIEDDANAPGQWRGRVTSVGDWFTLRRSVLPEPVQLHDVRTLECIVEFLAPPDRPNEKPAWKINQRMRLTIGP